MSWTITPQQRFTPAALLDRFPGAAAAYSLRNLVGTSNPSVVRVRRSSDNTEQDFTAAQVTDGTLTTFCGAGDGFVRTWYDQSELGNHAQQSSSASQPQIVSGGQLLTKNTRPTIVFDGTNDFLDTGSHKLGNTELFMGAADSFFVSCVAYRVAIGTFIGKAATTVGTRVFQLYVDFVAGFGNVLTLNARGSISVYQAVSGGSMFLSQTNWDSASGIQVLNTNQLSVTVGTAANDATQRVILGARTNGTGFFLSGGISECLIYDSSQTRARAAIAADTNAHYAIY
jgi:hypothetical protein